MHPPSTFLFCALIYEARPLIAHYRLQKQLAHNAFVIYRRDNMVLTVTGIGKPAMAAGVAYTLASYPASDPIVINLGLAGHARHDLESVFAIHRIEDADTGVSFHPGRSFLAPCRYESLISFAKAQTDYHPIDLIDMEASAFYATAMRFTCVDLAQCLKVVSDNTNHPVEQIDRHAKTPMTEALIPVLERWLPRLTEHQLPETEPAGYLALIEDYRFSHNERLQLRQLLNRWQALTEGEPPPRPEHRSSGKAMLAFLRQKLADLNYSL